MKEKNILLAITGASGAIYGLTLGKELLSSGMHLTLLVSATGFQVIREETGLNLKGDNGDVQQALAAYFRPAPGQLDYFSEDDFFAPVASGSSAPDAMVICPCSMGTLSRIACGISRTLLERCADVMSISYGIPNSASAFAASFMMSRSESLPMTIDTRGLLAIVFVW